MLKLVLNLIVYLNIFFLLFFFKINDIIVPIMMVKSQIYENYICQEYSSLVK